MQKHIDMKEVITKAKKGDEDSFHVIYGMYWRYVLFIASKLCNNEADVNDVLQNVFLQVFRNIKQLQDESKLKQWIRTTTARECYSESKKSKRFIIETDVVPEDIVDQDEDFLPEAYLQKKELRKKILEIVSSLPKKQRDVIYLYYYAEMRTGEIAEFQNCSVESVRKAMYDARQNIKRKLEEDDKKKFAFIIFVPLAKLFDAEFEVFAAQQSIPTADTAYSNILKTFKGKKIAVKAIRIVTMVLIACLIIMVVSCRRNPVSTHLYLHESIFQEEMLRMGDMDGQAHGGNIAVEVSTPPPYGLSSEAEAGSNSPYSHLSENVPQEELPRLGDTADRVPANTSEVEVGTTLRWYEGTVSGYDFLGWVTSIEGLVVGSSALDVEFVTPYDIMEDADLAFFAVWGCRYTNTVGVRSVRYLAAESLP